MSGAGGATTTADFSGADGVNGVGGVAEDGFSGADRGRAWKWNRSKASVRVIGGSLGRQGEGVVSLGS
jgi:hypothetical protein